MLKFELGQRVKDKVTGFSGIVVCISSYLTGCNRYAVQAQTLDRDGKIKEWQYFDEDLLLIAGKSLDLKVAVPGGPPRMEAPQR